MRFATTDEKYAVEHFSKDDDDYAPKQPNEHLSVYENNKLIEQWEWDFWNNVWANGGTQYKTITMQETHINTVYGKLGREN